MTSRSLRPALVAALALLALAPAAHALDCTWNANVVGDWETASNWSCNAVPDGDDDATVSSGTVTLNADHTVRDFTQTSGTVGGTGALTVTGALDWTFGTMNTDLTLAATGTGALSGSTHTLGDGVTLRLDGDVAWTGGQIRGGAGTVLDNNAVLTSTTNQPMTWSGSPSPRPVFDNGGTFRFDHPSTASNFFVLDNGGAVEVQQGTSAWREGGTLSSAFDIASGATLDLSAGAFDLTAATVTGAGMVRLASGTLNVLTDESIPTFVFTSGTVNGPGTLTVTSDLAWSFGTMNTDLTLAASGTGTLSGSTHTLGPDVTLRLDGDVAWTGGQIRGGAGTVLDNNAVLTSTTNQPMTWSGSPSPRPVFDNGGTFRFDHPSTASNFFVLDNDGAVEVEQGTSTWREGGSGTGSFTVATAGTLDFSTGTFDLTSITIDGAGTVDFSGTATTLGGTLDTFTGAVLVSGGTLALDADLSLNDFAFSNGTVNGPGDITVAGDLSWSFGTMNTDLTLAASGTGTLSGSTHTLGPDVTLRLDGDVAWAGGQIRGGAGATLDNNATLTSTTNQPMTWSGSPSPRPVFDNGGTFRFDHPSTASNFFVLDNDGTVEVQQGTTAWREGGTSSGTFAVASGAALDFNAGSFDLTAASIAGAGIVDFSGTATSLDGTLSGLTGTVQVSGGTLALGADETVPALALSNGTINGPGTLTVTGALDWTFGTTNTDLTLAATGTGALSGSTHTLGPDVTLRLDGDVAWAGGQIRGGAGATLDNNATLTSTTNQPMTWSGSPSPRPVFDNGGTFRFDHPSTASNFFVLDNDGTVEVQQGTSAWREGGANAGSLQIAGGAEFELVGTPVFTNAASGVVGGDGTFDGPFPSSGFVNEGTFAPGASPGGLAYTGTYDMSATATTALAIEIDGPTVGTEYDQLAVTGDVALGGTLDVTVPASYDPATGESFDVLTWTGTRSGAFASLQGLTLPNDKRLDPVFSSDRLTLIVVSDGSGNTPPDANDDALSVLEDATDAPLDVLANDSDGDGDPLTLAIVTGPTNGTASVSDGGTPSDPSDDVLLFSPNDDFFGTDAIVYSVDDGNGETDTATVAITVDPVNDEPSFTLVADPDQAVQEDAGEQTVSEFVTGFTPGPANESGQSPTYVLTSNAGLFQALSVNAAGDLTYTPLANAAGVATVTVSVRDDGGTANGGDNTSPSQTFQVTVTPVNDAPTFALLGDQSAADDAGPQSVPDFASSIDAGGGADEDGQAVSFAVATDANALFSSPPAIDTDGTLTYTPEPGQSGTATVTVVATDDGGTDDGGDDTSGPQAFDVVITLGTPPNSPPVIASLDGDTTGDAGDTFSFTADASDPDAGDALTYAWDFGDGTAPQSGVDLTDVAHVYATAGTYTLALTVADGNGGADAATLSVAVDEPPPPNQDPVIASLSGDTMGDEGDLFNYAAAATDDDGDPVTYTWDFGDGTAPVSGVDLTSVSHVYAAAGAYTLALTVTDGNGGSDSATLAVTVNEPTANAPPVIVSLTGDTMGETGDTFEFLAAATDGDGDPITYTWDFGDGTAPQSGVDLTDVAHVYATAGTYTLALTVADGNGGADAASLTVTVDEPAGAPDVVIALAASPTTVPAGGGPVTSSVTVTNGEPTAQTVDVWVVVTLPDGRMLPRGSQEVAIQAGETLSATFQRAVAASAPTGSYTVTGRVGDRSAGVVYDSDAFVLTKAPGASGGAALASARQAGSPVADPTADPAAVGVAAMLPSLDGAVAFVAPPPPPAALAVVVARPNPFSATTTVAYEVPEVGPVRLVVYDVQGREVAVVVDRVQEPGRYEAVVDASGLPAGVYVYRLLTGSGAATGRMTVVR